MRTAAPRLLPILRSRLQGELLAAVLLNPGREESLSEMARRLGADVATVQREVDRLEASGIVRSRRIGRARVVSADQGSPLVPPLTALILQTFGPVQVVREEMARLRGVERVALFGSWAARYEGRPGRAPVDVDVLIVGTPNRDEVHDAVLRAEHRLGRRVNATIRSADAWDSAQDGFVRRVRSSPLVTVLPEEPT